MLQSEFTERTKVTLDGEQYAKVEAVYTNVSMDKDEFCAEWKKIRNSKLVGEIEAAMFQMNAQYIEQLSEIKKLKAQVKELEATIQQEQERAYENYHNGLHEALNDLAGKIVRTSFVEKSVYDVIEEEFGLGFIIKTKYEAGIPLSNAEIDYMVGKL